MMSRRRAGLVGAVIVAATLAGCSTVSRLNPFQRVSPEERAERGNLPAKSERVPVLALDENLKVAEALKGVGFTLPPPTAMAEWPLPGGTPEQSVEHVDAGANFQVAWRRGFGKGSSRNAHVTAPPVSAGGRVFVMDGRAQVSAIDATSGQAVWRVDLNPQLRRDRNAFGGGLAFADGRLYVTSGYRFVAALDAGTGQLLWRTNTRSPVHSAPTVAGGRVFAVTIDNEMETFDAATGRSIWRYQALVEPARILAASSPAISGDAVVAAFSSGELVALRAGNGTELWAQSMTRASRQTALTEIRDIPGRPIISRGDVFAGSHSGVFAAIDLRTGGIRWDPLPIVMTSTPWAAGDVVYVTSKAGEVICINRSTGQVYWITEMNAAEQPRPRRRGILGLGQRATIRTIWSGPMLASNRLITVSSDGRAAALDPRTGAILSQIRLGSPALIGPMAANGTIYVVTDDAELVAIR